MKFTLLLQHYFVERKTVLDEVTILGFHGYAKVLHELVTLFEAVIVADFLENFCGLRQHAFALTRGGQELRRQVPARHVEGSGVLTFTG